MKLEGIFLDSRFGRRIVLLFVVAAAVPVLLLGVLAHRGWTLHVEEQARQRLAEGTKASGLRLLDRLLAARALLQAVVDSDASAASVVQAGQQGLLRAVLVDSGAPVALRDQRLLAWWRGQREAPPGARLHVMQDDDGVRVVLSVHDDRRLVTVLGELEPTRLWRDFEVAGDADRACVHTLGGVEIHCAGERLSQGQPSLHARWDLFLRHEFGVDDWVFLRERSAEAAVDAAALPVMGIARQVVVAALLLVAVLSLVLVRRTIVPLQRLTAGTRRLAAGDYATRVAVSGGDEFGELGASFNEMAERIGEQVHEMAVLSSIDRDILEGGAADALAQRVLARLAELAPDACVGVARVDAAGARALQCHLQMPGAAPTAQRIVPSADGWQDLLACGGGWCAGPDREWLPTPARGPAVYLAPARWQDQLLGLVFVARPGARPDGSAEWLARVDALRDRIAIGLASTLRERQLVHRASHDSLTGLLNRAGLHDAIEVAIAQARDDAQPFALLFIDLDRFKTVNDTMGHAAGDELLRIAAKRLAGCLPEVAMLARPGGDEFVALLADIDPARLDAASADVCRRLGESFALRGQEVMLGASVGIAVYPDDGQGADELLRHADMAMYAAKQRGRGRSARFEAALDAAAMRYAQVLNDLRLAVPRGELVLHYQPRIDASTGRARSVEALVRWNHPARGLLPPAAFVDVAEETGLIVEIGRWVLQEACRQFAAWRREGVRLSHVAVNVSVGQLRSPVLAADVEAALRAHGLAPADLEIEVTESLMVGDPEAAASLLRRLASTGVRIALDDFGTGYSSMSYLRYMPIDVIKVDRAFVRDLGNEPSAEAVTRAIVALATSLEMSLVAEGVETEAQAALLRAMGCQELQGYLYARPLPPEALAALPFVEVGATSGRDVEVLP